MEKATLPSTERLKSKKIIEELFEKGTSHFIYPYKFFIILKGKGGKYHAPQVLFTVPKKRFQHAVDRNLIKRRSRESYRTHKYLITNVEKHCYIGYIYLGKKLESSEVIEKGIVKSINKINEFLEKYQSTLSKNA